MTYPVAYSTKLGRSVKYEIAYLEETKNVKAKKDYCGAIEKFTKI